MNNSNHTHHHGRLRSWHQADGNAVHAANTPVLDQLFQEYAHQSWPPPGWT